MKLSRFLLQQRFSNYGLPMYLPDNKYDDDKVFVTCCCSLTAEIKLDGMSQKKMLVDL